MAVTKQPGDVPMMPNPGAMPGVPSGLEYLTQVDQLICKQQIEVAEVLTGIEFKNRYRIFNSMEQQVFYVYEESDTCHRICCGPGRGFTLHVQDNYQQEVITIERPFRCWKGCCWCADGFCAYPVYVKDRQGNHLGTIQIKNSKCSPHFGIYDENDEQLYDIWGRCCQCQCICGCKDDIKLPMRNMKDDTVVGNISKIWSGAFRELITKADTFGVTFPMDLEVKHKALMIGAVFVIDYMVFENQQ